MNLNDQIDTASKFTTPPVGVPQKDQSAQIGIGLEWAKRVESRPAPEPIKTLTPIYPIPN
jgi:hypothetical protein